MSRRKKSSPSRRSNVVPAASEPNPPRPNKVFLVATCLLLAAWLAFLIVLAV